MISTREEYSEAIRYLKKLSDAYYNSDTLLASDDEYDNLMKELKEYELKHNFIHPLSPTQKVGYEVASSFKKLEHEIRLYSQQDIFTIDDFVKWYENIIDKYGRLCLIAEPKYDGLTLSLVYEDGELKHAITRGNGLIGEDVFSNAKYIGNIPLTISLKRKIIVNGEVVMSKKRFDIINKKRENNGEALLANPRNAAAGAIRSLDSRVVKERGLEFLAWELKDSDIESLQEGNEILKNLNFKAAEQMFVCRPDLLEEVVSKYTNKRDSYNYGLDGVVFKVNKTTMHDKIGYTVKYPKWSVAMKFEPVEKTTKIIDIKTQVGRTGIITPVAILEPTLIDGSVVSRVTLHNYQEIKRKDIRINDYIILIKSGDIIPKITHVFKERRDDTVKVVKEPEHCPTCGTGVIKEDTYIKCPNEECPSRIGRKIMHFVGRDYMNIDGLGPSVINKLVDAGYIKSLVDIYKLQPDDVYSVGGFTMKGVDKLLKSIDTSKDVELDRFIAALGIPNFGRTLAKRLTAKYGMDLLNFTKEELMKEDGIGEEIAEAFDNYMHKHKNMISEFKQILNLKVKSNTVGKLSGEKIVLTGSFPNGKSKVKKIIEDSGGDIVSSVTKDTTMLVYGESPGSKLNKAKLLNKKILTYEELLTLIK